MFMRQFTSRKLKKKIVEIYDWKELAEDISMENISLPDSSKDYITKAYSVTKVNAKGKKQTRYSFRLHTSFHHHLLVFAVLSVEQETVDESATGMIQELTVFLFVLLFHRFRLIKFTHNSFLNVDPKTKRVQNEKVRYCKVTYD